LEVAFRDVWTDNADAISILYTGTPALKTDFTRTGKRSYMGAFNDGVNSVTRYYINNFCDGYNHDCLDIAQKQLTYSSLLIKRGWLTSLKISLLSIVALVYAAYQILAIYVPEPYSSNEELNGVQVLHSLVYMLVVAVGISYIFSKSSTQLDALCF
jgi:hypothetical protein